jgi:hypothetical protein
MNNIELQSFSGRDAQFCTCSKRNWFVEVDALLEGARCSSSAFVLLPSTPSFAPNAHFHVFLQYYILIGILIWTSVAALALKSHTESWKTRMNVYHQCRPAQRRDLSWKAHQSWCYWEASCYRREKRYPIIGLAGVVPSSKSLLAPKENPTLEDLPERGFGCISYDWNISSFECVDGFKLGVHRFWSSKDWSLSCTEACPLLV